MNPNDTMKNQNAPTTRQAFEELLGANPRNPELREHARALAATDSTCLDLEWQLARAQAWDHKLLDSLNQIAVPALLSADILRHVDAQAARQPSVQTAVRPRAARRMWFIGTAAAAVLVVASSMWLSTDVNQQMARECAEHMTHEPFALTKTEPVPQALLQRALGRVGFQGALPANVTYAMPCPINGQLALHTVIQSEHGPVTVFVFAKGGKSWRSDEIHHRGTMVRTSPHEGGAFVLVAESNAAFNQIEAALLAAS